MQNTYEQQVSLSKRDPSTIHTLCISKGYSAVNSCYNRHLFSHMYITLALVVVTVALVVHILSVSVSPCCKLKLMMR